MFGHLAATAGLSSFNPDTDIITTLTTWGPPGVVVILLIVGWLIPKWVKDNMIKERDTWQAAFEKEQDAHQVTREALAAAAARADVAVENAKTTTQLLVNLGHVITPQVESRKGGGQWRHGSDDISA